MIFKMILPWVCRRSPKHADLPRTVLVVHATTSSEYQNDSTALHWDPWRAICLKSLQMHGGDKVSTASPLAKPPAASAHAGFSQRTKHNPKVTFGQLFGIEAEH
ncbi:unnamed protein product [Durusdinium trenchii]|uniref:Uncharacterized protein n=1 Tax=Durusdinium trenchii TaxID=1381693 RepID=A0ABP0I718_9DINO